MSKKLIAILCAASMLLVLIPALAIASFAADEPACPAMPLGATNYADIKTALATGEELVYYNDGVLLLQARKSANLNHGNGMIKYALSDEVTTADETVISFWTRLESGTATLRFLETETAYYEMQYSTDKAVVSLNGANTVATFKLDNDKVMADATQTNVNGSWKKLDVYLRPATTAGKVQATFFVNGVAMKDGSGNATIELDATKVALGFGNINAMINIVGIRLYKVDATATAFEPDIDPAALFTSGSATSGADGGDGLVDNPSAFTVPKAEDMMIEQSTGDEDLSSLTLPKMPAGGINFALGATATYVNSGDRVYDADNGYMKLQSQGWAGTSDGFATLDLDIKGINVDDEYVISFILQRPTSWGQTYPFELTFGNDGTKTQKLTLTTQAATYTNTVGMAKSLMAPSGAFANGVPIAIHCYPDGSGTRTIDVYGGGILIGHMTKQAILPIDVKMVGCQHQSYPQQVMGLRVYKVDKNATSFALDATATQEQSVKNPGANGSAPTNLIANTTIGQAVNSAPTNYSGVNYIDLTGIVTNADSYVISAYIKTPAAMWGGAGLQIGAAVDGVNTGYLVQMRHSKDSGIAGMWHLGHDGISGYGNYRFYPGGVNTVDNTYYKVSAFVTPSATEGAVDIYIYVNETLVTKYNWADQTGANGGKITKAGFVPGVGINGTCGGLVVYKTSGTTYEPYNFEPSFYEDTEAPIITGIKDGDWYSTDRYFTVVDQNPYGINHLQSVTVNGKPAESIGYNTYVLPTGQGRGSYDVVATDDFGNKTEMTIISNAVSYKTVSITWANTSYILTGITEGDGEVQSGAKSFTAETGSTVTITCVDDTLATYGTIKNAGWGWLADNAYSFTVTEDIGFVLQAFANPTVTLEIEGEGAIDGFAGGYVKRYSQHTLTPVAADGWVFSHFELDGEIITEAPLQMTVQTSSRTVKAVFVEDEVKHTITVEDAIGGTVIGAPTDKVVYGDTVELTANANDGYTFQYWVINNRTYTDATITLTVKADTTVKAVFTANEPAEDYDPVITFRAKDGRIVATMTKSELMGGAELPTVPARYGFTGGEWEVIVPGEIEGDDDVYAVYTKDDVTYTVTVINGETSQKEAHFDDSIRLIATVDGFKAWMVGGVIVSTDAEYRCFVTGDMTIEAVTEVTDKTAAAVRVDGMAAVAGKFSLVSIASVYVADGQTFVEAGIVYSVTADDEDTLVIGAAGVGKKTSSIDKNGQFMYVLTGAPANTEIFVRSYVVTKNAEGELVTTYSDVDSYICNA